MDANVKKLRDQRKVSDEDTLEYMLPGVMMQCILSDGKEGV